MPPEEWRTPAGAHDLWSSHITVAKSTWRKFCAELRRLGAKVTITPVIANKAEFFPAVSNNNMKVRLAVAIGLTAVMALAALFAYRAALQSEARELLATAAQIAASDDPTAAFTAVQKRYGNRLRRVEGCPETECAYEVSVSNRPLALLRLAPYTELKLRFDTMHDRLAGTMVDYRTVRSGKTAIVHVQTDYCRECRHLYLCTHGRPLRQTATTVSLHSERKHQPRSEQSRWG